MARLRTLSTLAVTGCLTLCGCQATIATAVDVSREQARVMAYSVTVTGELAAAIRSDPSTDQGIIKVLSDNTGSAPTREDNGQQIDYVVSDPAKQAPGSLTGLDSVTVSGSGDTTTATLDLVVATGLQSALEQATAGEPDQQALLLAYAKATRLEVRVRMPGNVLSAEGTAPVRIDGNDAVVSQSLASAIPGKVTVVSGDAGNPILRYSGFVLLAAGLAYGAWSLVLSRRRRNR